MKIVARALILVVAAAVSLAYVGTAEAQLFEGWLLKKVVDFPDALEKGGDFPKKILLCLYDDADWTATFPKFCEVGRFAIDGDHTVVMMDCGAPIYASVMFEIKGPGYVGEEGTSFFAAAHINKTKQKDSACPASPKLGGAQSPAGRQ